MAYTTLEVKCELLSENLIRIKEETIKSSKLNNLSLSEIISDKNLYSFPWIFLKIGNKNRVRMTVATQKTRFELHLSESSTNRYSIFDCDNNQYITTDLTIEKPVFHCPNQVYYNLYSACAFGCKFCPLSSAPRDTALDVEFILNHIKSVDRKQIDSIGITSGIPKGLSPKKVAMQMAEIIKVLRQEYDQEIPIGVSPKQPSAETIILLKQAGADEIRLNIEIFNTTLSSLLTPNKHLEKTLESISDAVDIFGRGKVSSNMVIGLGESDSDVLDGVEHLAQMGAVATLYPYDPVDECDAELSRLTEWKMQRPTPERLQYLANCHKAILENNNLDPRKLKTMCPYCAGSHIMPGVDL